MDAAESDIQQLRDEMRAEFSAMHRRIDELERRMQRGYEAMRRLLYEGDDETMRLTLVHEEILAQLSRLQEEWDAEDADSDGLSSP